MNVPEKFSSRTIEQVTYDDPPRAERPITKISFKTAKTVPEINDELSAIFEVIKFVELPKDADGFTYGFYFHCREKEEDIVTRFEVYVFPIEYDEYLLEISHIEGWSYITGKTYAAYAYNQIISKIAKHLEITYLDEPPKKKLAPELPHYYKMALTSYDEPLDEPLQKHIFHQRKIDRFEGVFKL